MVGDRSGWINGSRAHLEAVDETYWQHHQFAWRVGAKMIFAGFACILHSLVPALFPDKASRTIRQLNHVVQYRAALDHGTEGRRSPLVVLCLLSFGCAALPWIAGAQAIIAFPLSLLSLGFVIAYGWSEEGQGSPIELLVPMRFD